MSQPERNLLYVHLFPTSAGSGDDDSQRVNRPVGFSLLEITFHKGHLVRDVSKA
jgi:hypothetical protein